MTPEVTVLEQNRFASSLRAEIGDIRPYRFIRIGMHDRVAIAVDVNGYVGIERPLKCCFLDLLNCASFGQFLGVLTDDAPQRMQVCYFVASQFESRIRGHAFSNRGPVTIEVALTTQIISAHEYAVDPAGCTNRIDERNQHDFAANFAARVTFIEAPCQVRKREHAGYFLSMETRLQVNLRSGATGPVSVDGNVAAG